MSKILSHLLVLLVFGSLWNISFAEEQVIAVIKNDKDARVSKLVVDVHDQRQIKAFYKDYQDIGKPVARVFLGNDIKNNAPLIIEKRDKRIVVQLECENFDPEQGGHVVINTLYNGITDERKSYELELSKKLDGRWALFKNKKQISNIYIKMNRVVFIGEVGISELLMN